MGGWKRLSRCDEFPSTTAASTRSSVPPRTSPDHPAHGLREHLTPLLGGIRAVRPEEFVEIAFFQLRVWVIRLDTPCGHDGVGRYGPGDDLLQKATR